MVDLSAITVTYNNEETIDKLIESLKRFISESSEILVVDNASTDNTLSKLKRYTGIKVIESKINLGFSRANNLAAREALGKYLFFINPDASLKDGSVREALNYLEGSPSVGLIAPKIYSGKQLQSSVRRLPTIRGAIEEYYLGKKNSYKEYAPGGDKPVQVEGVVGAAMIIPKDLFLEIGGFDQKYFMYFEDLDLCRKIRRLGKKIIYYPGLVVSHQIGHSFAPQKGKWLKESAFKYHGLIKYGILTLVLRLRPKS